jgi:hypothetical protein
MGLQVLQYTPQARLPQPAAVVTMLNRKHGVALLSSSTVSRCCRRISPLAVATR